MMYIIFINLIQNLIDDLEPYLKLSRLLKDVFYFTPNNFCILGVA
jgi:hypothetical protein